MPTVKNAFTEKLFELGDVLSRQVDFEEIVRIVTQKSAQLLGAEFASVVMVNPATQETIKTIHKSPSTLHPSQISRLQNQVSGWILLNEQPLLSKDIKRDDRFKKAKLDDIDAASVIGVPLVIENTSIGSLLLFRKKGTSAFETDDLDGLLKISILAAPYLRTVEKVQQYFQVPLQADTLIGKYAQDGLIGRSDKFVALLKSIEAAARSDVRVLLEGETGSGKELVARAIHNHSPRANAPFVALDCGAVSQHLMESELFGHMKGSFTGATQDRKGLFQQADNGTLFLDEIGNLSADMQIKLLRALQTNEVRPVGSDVAYKVNVRVIAAVSTPLKTLVERGEFRSELYYRLFVYPISIPNLAERRADIPVLANHFLKRFAEEQNKKVELFHPDILRYMKVRPWTGNIRELENFIERLVTLCGPNVKQVTGKVLPADLRDEYQKLRFSTLPNNRYSLQETLAEYERDLIVQALEQSQWNQSEAARILQIAEGTLRYKMKQLGIKKSE